MPSWGFLSINQGSDFPATAPLKSPSFPSDVTLQGLGGRLDQVLVALSCVLYLAPLGLDYVGSGEHDTVEEWSFGLARVPVNDVTFDAYDRQSLTRR